VIEGGAGREGNELRENKKEGGGVVRLLGQGKLRRSPLTNLFLGGAGVGVGAANYG